MEEIKVGDYIRTIDGYIRKVTQVNKKGTYEAICYGAYSVDKKYKNSVGISAKKVKSHSFDISELLEVEDIVEYRTGLYSTYIVPIHSEDKLITIKESIKKYGCLLSILTHEQFNSMKYIVGDESNG